MNSKNIRITFEKKTLKLSENVKTFEQLKNFMVKNFDSLPEKIRIYYIDQDQDEITISCNEDLETIEDAGEDIEIKIRPYQDSDATDSEVDDEDEDDDVEEVGSSSLSESDSRGQAKEQKANQSQNQQANNEYINHKANEKDDSKSDIDNTSFSENDEEQKEAEEFQELKTENLVNKQDQSTSQDKNDNDQSVQCGNFIGSEMKDQSNQVGVCVKDQEQQVFVNQCDQSNQARIKQCDAQDQTCSVESKDYSTQFQIESKDTQSQAQVEQRDNSLQTQQIEYRDNEIQTKVEQADYQLQADVIQQQDFSSQAYSNNQKGLGSQLCIPNYSVMGTNTEEMLEGNKQAERQNKSVQNISQYYEEKIRALEEGQEFMMKKLIEQEKRFDEKLQSQKGFLSENLINSSIEERIKQLVDSRVNDLLPEYSRANWDNFRRSDKLSRFDRIFQEISPQFNKLALMKDANQLYSAYDELTSTLMQKLEIARDMYKKEILQNQNQSKLSFNSSSYENNQDCSKLKEDSNFIEQEEESKENLKQSQQIKTFMGNESKPADPPIIIKKKESTKPEDDCIYEERLKDYQEKLRRESVDEEENIRKILKQKEQEANKLNEEVIENLHKDYPADVVEKAKQIAALTQQNPNKYLKYVLDYKNHNINDLIDMSFNENIMDKYKDE